MSVQSNQPTIPDLPSLVPGITLVDVEGRAVGPVQTLVLDHLLCNGSRARWIDTHGHANIQSLARLASSSRVLDRIQVARGFTVYQHYSLVDDLTGILADDGETPLIVVPAIDGLYRDPDGALSTHQASTLLVRALAALTSVAHQHDVPVVITRRHADSFSEPVETAAETVIQVEDTRYGPRFTSDSFESLVYPLGHGVVQTTLAYWQRILDARQPVHTASPSASTSSSVEGVAYGAH